MPPILHVDVPSACPLCEGIDVEVASMSPDELRVRYLQCVDCGDVWIVPKDSPDAEPSPATPVSGDRTPPTGTPK
jgi:hypothetical protein